MNNTRYIQWAMDVIDLKIHQDYFVSDLNIQYKKEIRPLEDVSLYLASENERYVVEGRIDDNAYFVVEIQFTKRK